MRNVGFWFIRLIGIFILGFSVAQVGAQTYPDKPVRLLVGFAPGGAADIVARQIGAKMSQQTGQQFVVDNKPGATGTVAAANLASSPPDGYALMLASQSTMVIAPSMYKKLPFDPLVDFKPISMLVSLPMVVVVNSDMPVKSLKDLIALAKKDKGNFAYASSGVGGPQHIATELLLSMTGVDMNHVPYKGESSALTDVMGGQVPFMFSNIAAAMPMVATGKLRVLAISSAKRSPNYPDIPTVNEALGLTGFEVLTWYGLFAPAKTSNQIINKIYIEAANALKNPAMKSKLNEEGYTVVGSNPEQFSGFIKSETARWVKVIKSANITAD